MAKLRSVKLGKKIGYIRRNWTLYLLILPALAYVAIFLYGPMYGVLMAFQDFSPAKGIWGSNWVGLKHFKDFFNSYNFKNVLSNTIYLSFYQLLAGFPLPIIFALLLNQLSLHRLKKTVQTVSYAPHFISTVVMVGILEVFLSPSTGLINVAINQLGGSPVDFLSRADMFRHIYVVSGIWQNTGYSSVIYIAALAGINPELHEAATVDGANKLQRIIYIDIPGILPTAITLLILNVGRILSIGFEKAFLMQRPLNITTSEIISTYVYKIGLINAQFSYSTAIGLFNSVVGCLMLLIVNYASRKLTDVSLW